MTGRSSDGAVRLMTECLGDLGDVHAALVVGEPTGALAESLAARGARPERWLREASPALPSPPLPWPEGDGFDAVFIRLPKSKGALLFALHAATSRMKPGGTVVLYGANAEGIRSIAKRLEPFATDISTLATGHHARVLVGRRRDTIAGLKRHLSDWRQVGRIEIAGTPRPWVSYPGTFAKGGLDDGTALLLQHLPRISSCAHVLDFAAGTGVIAAAIRALSPRATIDMIEADALALAAARENVPDSQALPGTGLAAAGERRYDVIVSNPPIHDGIAESHAVLERLIAEAPAHLSPSGTLMLVVQRRVAVLPLLAKALAEPRIVADDGRFTIAQAGRAARAR